MSPVPSDIDPGGNTAGPAPAVPLTCTGRACSCCGRCESCGARTYGGKCQTTYATSMNATATAGPTGDPRPWTVP